MSSPYIDILTPIFHRISGVHIRIVHQLLPVPFRSVPGFIPSLKEMPYYSTVLTKSKTKMHFNKAFFILEIIIKTKTKVKATLAY